MVITGPKRGRDARSILECVQNKGACAPPTPSLSLHPYFSNASQTPSSRRSGLSVSGPRAPRAPGDPTPWVSFTFNLFLGAVSFIELTTPLAGVGSFMDVVGALRCAVWPGADAKPKHDTIKAQDHERRGKGDAVREREAAFSVSGGDILVL